MSQSGNTYGSIGSSEPPPGVEPNFTNPYSLKTYSTLILSICLPILTLIVWVRLYTRLQIAKSAGWEDLCALLAWLGVVGYATTGIIAFRNGVGSHQWNVTISEVHEAAKASYASVPLYRLTLIFAKLAILLQLLQIFVPGKRGTIYYAVNALIWFTIISHSACILVAIFQCTPIRKSWKPATPGQCIDIRRLLISTAVINVFSDFSILLLPLYSIWRLQMPVKRKFGVSAVFSLGGIACIASVIHLAYDIKSLRSQDLSWVGAPILMSAYVPFSFSVLRDVNIMLILKQIR